MAVIFQGAISICMVLVFFSPFKKRLRLKNAVIAFRRPLFIPLPSEKTDTIIYMKAKTLCMFVAGCLPSNKTPVTFENIYIKRKPRPF